MSHKNYITIMNLIKEGQLEEAKKLINQIKLTEKTELSLKMMHNYVSEQEYLQSLTPEDLAEYNKIIEAGSRLYKAKKNQESLDVYRIGEYRFNTPIFKYYIGKLLYKMHDYELSAKYLREYIIQGSDKLPKAYLYLYKIEQGMNREEQVELLQRVDELNKDFNPTFKLRRHETKKIKSRH